ncbi:MAG: sigma-54 dependent transcriptional regulator [Bacteroidales bacterium]|nr:sigma-54 dependent transcriptional regulator [Bacteroidales bacterium]
MKKARILVVDDNQGIRNALKLLLSAHFEQVEIIASPKTLVSAINSFMPDVVLLDMNFYTDINTGNEGLYWTTELKRMFPDIQVVLFTAYADIALAVEGMKRGAFDFIVKPWDNTKLIETLIAASSIKKGGNTATTRETLSPNRTEGVFWGTSSAMLQIKQTLLKVAPTDATILITGENGTGKDVLAHEIHAQSSRRNRKMVCVDAGAITDTLFESEVFGHVKGAFTDAHTDHVGKFEQANGGTLFLDEIGNIPLHLQAKLLRVIQNRTVTRVGSDKQIPVDIRLICATNMDLEKMVLEGKFREDLYYRINTLHLHLPALRDRADDILSLSELFLKKYAEKYHRSVSSISQEAALLLKSHCWNGNVRELQNVIEKAVIMSEGNELLTADITIEAKMRAQAVSATTLDEAEEQTIRNTMARCGANLSMVARELGISRPTLYSKLKKYGI